MIIHGCDLMADIHSKITLSVLLLLQFLKTLEIKAKHTGLSLF